MRFLTSDSAASLQWVDQRVLMWFLLMLPPHLHHHAVMFLHYWLADPSCVAVSAILWDVAA